MNSYAAVCRLREVMRRQHMAFRTESMYVYWLKRYCNAVQRMPPDLTSEKKVERFLTDLATINNVAASTQNQAFNAVLFFISMPWNSPSSRWTPCARSPSSSLAARPHRRRNPRPASRRARLGPATHHLIARLIYGAGLRVTEPLNLRIKDINLEKSALFIMVVQGGDDRVVPLPASLRSEIAQQIHLRGPLGNVTSKTTSPCSCPTSLPANTPNISSLGHGPGCSLPDAPAMIVSPAKLSGSAYMKR